jgi:anti-sigma B factor antagonist
MPESAQPQRPTPGELVICAEHAPDAAIVVTLEGELDLASAAKLEEELLLIEAGRPPRIVIDLSGLTFMDSTGMRTLALAQRRSLAERHELLLRRGPHQVQRVFELTGSVEMFTFED